MNDWSYKQKAVVLVVLGVVCLAYFHKRIYSGLAGPFDVEVKDLVLMEEVPAREWVRVVRDGRPVQLTELTAANFREHQVNDDGGAGRAVATFRYLEQYNRRVPVRVTENSEREVAGVLTSLKDTTLSTYAPGEAVYLDCENTNYRIVSLGALALGLMAIGLGIDQARRGFRKT